MGDIQHGLRVLSPYQRIITYFATDLLIALVPQITEKHLPEAIDAAREIKSAQYRSEALISLAPYDPKLISEAIDAARETKNAQYRSEALSALAPYNPKLISEAIDAALKIKAAQNRTKALSALVPQMIKLVTIEQLTLHWRDILHSYELNKRQDVLEVMAALTPVIVKLGGQDAVSEIVQVTQQVCHWWR